MEKEEFFLVVRFKKKEKKKLMSGIVFEPFDVVTSTIENGFITVDGKKIPCLESFEPNSDSDEFYGFPLKICERVNGNNLKIINNDFFDKSPETLLEEVKSFEYAYTYGSKDEKFVSMIYAISKNGDLTVVDFSTSFYANFFEFIDEYLCIDENSSKKQELKREDILNQMYSSVVSQDEQVKVLVDTVLSNQRYAEYEGLKENLMIIGPTGTGKTLMCKTLSKILEVPIIIKDATKYSSTGYVGLNVVDMLEDLCREADYDLDLAEKGIIVIDEFDKLGKQESSTGSNVRTKDVQHELLGMLDGGIYTVTIDKTTAEIDTSNITFVLAGAFQDILQKVSLENKTIGFGGNVETKKTIAKITREDLAKYGGIERELLRRISSVIQMNPLYEKELKQILKTSKISNLKVWQNAFLEKDGVKLICSEEAYDLIAEEAYKLGSGASGLKSIASNTISEIKAKILDGELNDCEIEITEETIKDPTKYLIKKKEKGMKYELSTANGANN